MGSRSRQKDGVRRPGSARSMNKGLEGGGPGGLQDAQGLQGRGEEAGALGSASVKGRGLFIGESQV